MAASIGKQEVMNVVCEKFKIERLEAFQDNTLKALLKGRDVYLSVKTGSGKSLCYQVFSSLWRSENNGICQIVTVTPLVSIMKEQCDFLINLGFTATYIGKDDQENSGILAGQYEFVFTSPESLLGVPMWREMLSNERTRLLVVDEAHTVLHWGDSDGDEDPFRSWYGKLGETRSLVSCPLLVITATANLSARRKMKKKFCMNDCLEIIDSPDRSNIKLFVHKYKSTLPLSELLGFILNSVQTKKDKCERCIIFCPSIKLCSDVYTMFRLELKDDIKFVQMFHSMTVDDVKEEVRADMNLSSGKIRVLVATSAAGMGVNFAGINSTIHIGPPKDMDSFVQQFGRSGRDGSQAMSLLLYSSKQCKKLDEDMTSYISTDTCRRKLLLSSYNAEPPKLCKHRCCDNCTKTCSCQDCSKFNHPFFEYAIPCYESQSSSDSDIRDSDDDMMM